MSKIIFNFILFFLMINLNNSQIKKYQTPYRPRTTYNSTTRFSSSLKFHSKLLQTVYSDSFSKNYYYTTLYVGDRRVRQTYILDTGSAVMSSPCSPCEECGPQKNNYFYDFNRYHKPLQCHTKICDLVPANNCFIKAEKNLNKNQCSFNLNYKKEEGEKAGLKGYYLRDIVYFETTKSKNGVIYRYNNLNNNYNNERIIYRSYAVPIGCTNAEYGEFRDLQTDGIMGLNNSPKSFISVLYNLRIIPENKFSLCFGLFGGYLSLGEVDTTYHKNYYINYIPLLDSEDAYLINLNGISLEGKENFVSGTHVSSIETRNSKSYFPQFIYKAIIKEFDDYCAKKNGACGKFDYIQEGYCATFPNRLNLFKSVYNNWPNITLHFEESEYIWTPLNYYYYSFKNLEYKACLGFDGHRYEKIILGANFIHGHDIIFDRAYKRLGFVPADCSRGNRIWRRHYKNESVEFWNDPSLIDLEIHKNNVFNLGDNINKDMVDFVEGHNTELDISEGFKTVNFIIFLSSLIIVGIIVIIILYILFWNKRGNLKYEPREEVEYNVEQQNESNTSDDNNVEGEGEGENQDGDNKISFEENNTNDNNNENNINENNNEIEINKEDNK